MYVLAIGNPFDGVDLIGPFVDYTDATDYAAEAYPHSPFTVEAVAAPDVAVALRAAVKRHDETEAMVSFIAEQIGQGPALD